MAFAAALSLLVHRGSRTATLWGGYWAIAAGMWLIAPLLLDTHHLRPTTLLHWMVFDGFVVVTCLVIGIVLSAVTAIPLAMRVGILGRDFRNPPLANAIWPLIWLPPAYLTLSAIIASRFLSGSVGVGVYALTFRPVAGVYIGFLALLIFVYARRAATSSVRVFGALVVAPAAIAVGGCLALPQLMTTGSALTHVSAPALSHDRPPVRPPLLVIGLDGGNWRAIQPVIDRGRAPTFARLIASGIHGDTPALWPPYWSSPAWAAIVTGHSPDENGVHEDLSAEARGLPVFELPLAFHPALNPIFAVEYGLITVGAIEPMPTPRSRLAWPPVWERLSHAGVNAAVLRFPFTYPAAGQAHYVVSNRIVTDLWSALGVQTGKREELTEPQSAADEWLARFADDRSDSALLARLLPRLNWTTNSSRGPLEVVRRVTTIRRQVNEGAKALLQRDPGIALLMMHVASLDEICHAFWQYRFPEDFPDRPPSAANIRDLGPVIDRYVEMIDTQLADLIAAFPSPPNVLVIADHGEGPTRNFQTLWRGWHDTPGMFVAAGPDVPHRSDRVEVSYYDIAPTILDLEGFSRAPDMRGHSVVAIAGSDSSNQ